MRTISNNDTLDDGGKTQFQSVYSFLPEAGVHQGGESEIHDSLKRHFMSCAQQCVIPGNGISRVTFDAE